MTIVTEWGWSESGADEEGESAGSKKPFVKVASFARVTRQAVGVQYLDGRSPGLRIVAQPRLPRTPGSSGLSGGSPFTVAGTAAELPEGAPHSLLAPAPKDGRPSRDI